MNAKLSLALRMGDNALILAQQNSKWCGHAPIVEEDIAFANIALDLIGQARFWLGLAAELEGAGRNADDLAFLRDASAFRNAFLVEQPNGDFGRTLMRQYLFDLWHLQRIENLCQSSDTAIAEIAAKSRNEVRYHLKRSRSLIMRLSEGTEESHARMQEAIVFLWPAFGSLFEDADADEKLAEDGIAAKPSSFREVVLEALQRDIGQSLTIPETSYFHKGAVMGTHSENLGHILADMQFLPRAYPDAEW